MKTKSAALIEALKAKRSREGLSLRALSARIGVSFSSLARIERGEGQPDNNSTIRILEWLGEEADAAGLSLKNVALVHFRARKNVKSKTIQCLLLAAEEIKRSRNQENIELNDSGNENIPDIEDQPILLSKPDMENMADDLRQELGIKENQPLDSLSIKITGVEVFTSKYIYSIDRRCFAYLTGPGSDEWSAMSIPLDIQNERWAIFLNDTHALARQRVTYLEECWHIMLGHRLTKIAKVADAYGRTYVSEEEHDAYYLAAATLLPESVVKNAIVKKISIDELAETYGVSPDLVYYRIKRLGLWRTFKNKEVKLSNDSG